MVLRPLFSSPIAGAAGVTLTEGNPGSVVVPDSRRDVSLWGLKTTKQDRGQVVNVE